MRLRHSALLFPFMLLLLSLGAPAARAEYVVLRSGLRLQVTGYELQGDKYRLQMKGGWVEVAAQDVETIEAEEVFVPIPETPAAQAAPAVQSPYRALVEAAAERYKVDADLIMSVIAAESNFDPKAISPKNARGLMQLLPETAARLGVQNIFDPRENIDGGTRYLSELLQKYNNDLSLALAAYNAGPERVQQYGRVPPIAETVSYVRRVKQNYDKSKSDSAQKMKPQATAPTSSEGGTAAAPSMPAPARRVAAPAASPMAAPPLADNN